MPKKKVERVTVLLFVVDVGNSNIVMGVYDGRRLVGQWRINTDRNKTPDQLHNIILQLPNYCWAGN